MDTFFLTSLAFLAAAAFADPPTEFNARNTARRMRDEEAIRDLISAQTTAWNRGDAAAFSSRFHQDGSFTNIMGVTVFGREAFEQRHADTFATIYKDSVLHLTIRRIQFVRPDMAIVDMDADVTGFSKLPPGLRTEPDGTLRTHLLQALVKESDGWWIAAFHNVDIKPLPVRP